MRVTAQQWLAFGPRSSLRRRNNRFSKGRSALHHPRPQALYIAARCPTMRLSLSSLKVTQPAVWPVTPEYLALADSALDMLWRERQAERGNEHHGHRAGSCKFAALLAQALFGGRLAGNDEHVFVVLADGTLLDLNEKQPDVTALGAKAWDRHDFVLAHSDYRTALGSCLPRVNRWVNRVKEATTTDSI